jgi:hypothetical protein
MRRALSFVLALAALAALVGAGVVHGAQGGRTFATTLSGAAEVGGGDPDGSGTAVVTLNPGTREVCYDISVTGISEPVEPAPGLGSAHIHVGAVGVDGGIVVDFEAEWSPTGSGFTTSDCVTASRTTLVNISMNPAGYYVNVHNADYPGGALRGQLSR